ncbi:MAG: GNAT family N-acetyltransferase [candidate division Zixibacteria bacterium]|nr:GNAT family N-acetyltransferase [candidate division Zixibacteria bacterium]
MSLEVLSLDKLPDSLLAIAQQSGAASPFYSRGLLSVWEQVYGWQGIVLHEDDCLSIGYRKKTPLGVIFYSLPFGWYGGLIGNTLSASISSDILAWLRDQRFVEERLVQTPNGPVLTYPKRYRQRELIAQLLDLTREATYSDNTARNVRKSRSHGLTTRRLSLADVAAFEKLREEHVTRTGETRRLSEAFYTALYLLTQSEDSGVTIVGAFHDDKLLAGHIYFISETDVFYFDGYATAAGLDLHANFFLFDIMINRSRDFGRARFNLGASPSGDSGLERFKSGWGAPSLVYHEYSFRAAIKRAADLLRGRP